MEPERTSSSTATPSPSSDWKRSVAEGTGQSIPGGPFVAPGVRERIYDHVFSSLEAEVGGVLVGRLRDDGSPRITDVIPALEADGARSRVTFTHEAWSTIHSTLDRDYPG